MKIYDDYGDEPQDEFIPLPASLADQFYDLEMESYLEDALFYDSVLPLDATVLELGCGSGRVGRLLCKNSRHVTGADISLSMLQKARSLAPSRMQFVAMDMTCLGFSCLFDTILIPYNTLNLLVTKENILQCLNSCYQYLKPQGTLICQLFVPTKQFIASGKKSFQFQIFDLPEGGRLIKEIIKEYHPSTKTISIEERYRLRPLDLTQKADYNTTYTVTGFSSEEWVYLLQESHFFVHSSFTDFNSTPAATSDSSCLITLCQKRDSL